MNLNGTAEKDMIKRKQGYGNLCKAYFCGNFEAKSNKRRKDELLEIDL